MRLLKKQLLVFSINLLVFVGLASTISGYTTSYIEGEALNKTITARFGTANLSSGWQQFGFTTTQGTDYVRFRSNESNYVITTSRSSLIDPLEQFTSSLTVTYKVGSFGGSGTSGTLRAELLDNANNVLINGTGSFSLTTATESYAQGSTITLSLPENPSNINTFKLILNSSSGFSDSIYLRLEELKITYTSELISTYDDSTNFATNLLNSTSNKENCFVDDNWTTLANSYSLLSTESKDYFKNTSTNQTIIDARERYNYLINFNNLLNDFIYS